MFAGYCGCGVAITFVEVLVLNVIGNGVPEGAGGESVVFTN
jgi:hypothetical protein